MGRQESTCVSKYIPVSAGEIRPTSCTAEASVITSAAPPTARLPRCTRCHVPGWPSFAEYWHIGETPMRFLNSISRKRRGVNSVMDSPHRVAAFIGFFADTTGYQRAPYRRELRLHLPEWRPQSRATSPSTAPASAGPIAFQGHRAKVEAARNTDALPPGPPETEGYTSVRPDAICRAARSFRRGREVHLQPRHFSFLRRRDAPQVTPALVRLKIYPLRRGQCAAPEPNRPANR